MIFISYQQLIKFVKWFCWKGVINKNKKYKW